MNNNYIFELPEFDTDLLFEYVATKIPKDWENSLEDKIVCNDFTNLGKILFQYPFLERSFNIYQLKKGSWPIHCDLGRHCSLNIPYKNCDESKVTRFYKTIDELKFGTVFDSFSDAKPKVNLKSNDKIGFVTSSTEIDFEHVLKVPTIIRNDVPHDVINYNDDVRIIISWTCRFTWDVVQEMLGNK